MKQPLLDLYDEYRLAICVLVLVLVLGFFLDLKAKLGLIYDLRYQEKNLTQELQQKGEALRQAPPVASHLQNLRNPHPEKPLLDQIIQALRISRSILIDLQTELKNARNGFSHSQENNASSSSLLIKMRFFSHYAGFYQFLEILHRQGLPLQVDTFSMQEQGGQLLIVLQLSAFPSIYGMRQSHPLSGVTMQAPCCERDPFRDAPILPLPQSSSAEAPKNAFDFDQVSLRTLLRILAKETGHDVILSSNIEGVVSLHLQKVPLKEVFTLLLKSHDLEAIPLGQLLYISPRDQAIKQKQSDARFQKALENAAPLVTRFWQIHYTKAEEVLRWLKTGPTSLLSERGQAQVDSRSNLVGVRDTAERLETIERLIQHLDVPLKQILIETRLASVDSDFERELGLRFLPIENKMEGSEEDPKPLSQSAPFNFAITAFSDNRLLDLKLAALENQGKGELISSPRLFTANQQTASIEAGEEIPYQETSRNGATSVVFKKAVLSLKVTPELLPGKKVLLQLQINQDRPNTRLVLGVPTISTRQLLTNVLVSSGQTVVLGGIYETNTEYSREGLPWLGSLPLLGSLFQVNHQRKNKRELLIFVTPRIIEWSG